MRDWGLGALSKLVWRAKLVQKRGVLDPASPSEGGPRSNPSCTGKAGWDRNKVGWGLILHHNGAETEKSATSSAVNTGLCKTSLINAIMSFEVNNAFWHTHSKFVHFQ
jgi:hypothetical protein